MNVDKNNSSPVITTIIPTYKRPKLLKRAIESVLAQTYPHFLVLVCDNDSQDETGDVVAELMERDNRIRYFCHEKNIGAINNFNFGLKQVQTPFFTILSDDNVLIPEFFELALKLADTHKEAAIIAGKTERITIQGQRRISGIDRWKEKMYYPPEGLIQLFEKGMLTWESILFRSQILQEIGLLNPDVSGSADRDFLARILARYPVFVIKKTFASFLIHSGFTSIRPVDEFYRSHNLILKQFLQDDRIPPGAKKRIARAGKKQLKRIVTRNIYSKAILQNDGKTLDFAIKIQKKDFPFSTKMYFLIWLGKKCQNSRDNYYFPSLLKAIAEKYLKFRKNIVINRLFT